MPPVADHVKSAGIFGLLFEPNGRPKRPIGEAGTPMQTTSDEALIQRIAGGDRLAMQVLFVRHHVRVYRFVLRFVRHEAMAEDLVSEVFLEVWRKAGTL